MFPWLILVPLGTLVLLASLAIVLTRWRQSTHDSANPEANQAHARSSNRTGTVEMQVIPLRDVDAIPNQKTTASASAAPYVSIPAPFKISTSQSHGTLV